MEISDLELFRVAPPQAGRRTTTLICITSTSGRQGWGEADLGWSAAILPARRQALLAALVGRSIYNIAELSSDEMLREAPLACAVETALWDLVGQSAGQPLCNLWGGMYRRQIPLAARVGAEQVLANLRAADELVEHGFRHLVLAASGDEQRDAAAIAQLHQTVGLQARLELDGRSQYSPDAALRLASALPTDAVALFLDPIDGDNLATIGSLAQIMAVPVALCRPITSAARVSAVIRGGIAQHVFIDPLRVGGLLATRRAVAAATAGRLATSLYLRRGIGIEQAAAVHVAACIVELDRHHILAGYNALARSDVQGLQISDGAALVPQLPGLGVTVNREQCEAAWIDG